MKKISVTIALLMVFSFIGYTYSQINRNENKFAGQMQLIIDVSNMKDTKGKFKVVIGAEEYYPIIKTNKLFITTNLSEPRTSFVMFYPYRNLRGVRKPLDEIAPGINDFLMFLAIPGKTTIVVKNVIAEGTILRPSIDQTAFFNLLALKKSLQVNFFKSQKALITSIKSANNLTIKDSLILIHKKRAQNVYYKAILKFISTHPDTPTSLIELDEYPLNQKNDLRLVSILYNGLSNRIKALPTAQRLKGVLDAKLFATKLIGKSSVNFVQSNQFGKKISLNDFRGHVVLLEFWASWCGPCRASNPSLVKINNKFKKNGFRILGVSLDDDKAKWLKAIKDDGLDWTHVSDLKHFNNSIAMLYHVNSIPSNFLISSTGKIVATNLDGNKLESELIRLFPQINK